jgi:hypothetical protein
MFIKITWDEVGGRVDTNRGRKAPYFTRHFDGFPALILFDGLPVGDAHRFIGGFT